MTHTADHSPHASRADGSGLVGYPESRLLCAETVHRGDGVVVFARGELDLASGPTLLRRLLELLSLPIDALTVDLAELTFIDSSGLAALNRARTTAAERNVRFSLASVPDQTQCVLEITGLSAVFATDEHPTLPEGFD